MSQRAPRPPRQAQPARPARRLPLTPIAILLAGLLAAAGYLLGQGALPVPGAPQAAATRPPVTPRTAGNATARATPTPLPPAAPTSTPPAPESDEPLPPLVFAREGQLWRSDGSGAPPRRLTDLPTSVTPSHPAISPDGAQVAFVALAQPPADAAVPLPTSRLLVMPAEGGEPRELWAPAAGILWLPSWSPDGRAIYMLANGTDGTPSGGESRLAIVRLEVATGERRTVVTDALDPTISRDGSKMAFLKFDEDGVSMHVVVAAPDGSGARTVIDGAGFLGFYAPRFSPDGRQIIVAAIEGPPTDERGFPTGAPPSGRGGPLQAALALLEPPAAEAHGTPWELWSVGADGSGLRRLTRFGEDLPMAAFSPDGRTVAVMAYGGIYLMEPDGSRLRRIDRRGDHGGLDWVR